MSFTVYPAIDVRGGRVVRLRQGDYAQETHYADDPLQVARAYAEQGANWLHLVDLDAARHGGYGLLELLRRVRSDTGLNIQTGGGVRCFEDVERILDAGAQRVVVGSRAVTEPDAVIDWLQRATAERITVALDSKADDQGRWMLPVHGWTADSGITLNALLERFATSGLRHVLCTDVGRDGMLSGPNLDLYRHLDALAPELIVQASGGVRDVSDVLACRAQGLRGVVLGRSLLEGRLRLDEALSC